MGQRLQLAVIAAAGPLEPGERVEIASAATLVGPAEGARRGLAIGIAAGVLTAGLGTIVAVPRRWGILLTDRRLLFVAGNDVTFKPGVEFAIPRQAVHTEAEPTGRMMKAVALLDADGNEVLALYFPAIVRRDGEALARSLSRSGSCS